MRRNAFEDVHKDFRESARRFVAAELSPHHLEWEEAGIVPREAFAKAGEMGMLAFEVPEEFGGTEVDDFRFNQIFAEEVAAAGVTGSGLGMVLHNDVCLPYFSHYGTDEQKRRWLPGIVSGELITAIAMTEPGVGSDLASMQATAVRDGDVYVVNGAKTFITNGINADLVIVAVKTDPSARHRGISLLVIERGAEGFERGRNLDKVGMHAQDTAELFFSDVRVPVENLLGEENKGFLYLVSNLPRERLSIAASAVGAATAALDWTVDYVKDRSAFGARLADLQTIQFALAEMRAEVELGTTYVDRAVEALNKADLTAEDAAVAKWWCSEMQGRVLDRCVQLHGGYGYMNEYPVARAWADARVTRIYGGTSEIMKGIVGKAMVS